MAMNTAFTAKLVESYVDNLELLELKDNKIYKLAGTVQAKGPEHFWLKDSVRGSKTPTAASQLEGRQFAGAAGTDAVRIFNTAQFFMEDVQVSGTTQRSDHYAIEDRFAFESEKAEKAVAKDIERAMIYGVRNQGAVTAGAPTTARSMDGIVKIIQTNAASNNTAAAGVVLNEDRFSSYLQSTWTNGDRDGTIDIFTSAKQKRAINLFTTPNQRTIEAKAKTVVLPVDTIATDFGEANIHLHREIAAGDLLGVDTSTVYKAMLLAPTTERYGKRGDSEDGAVKAELTVELRRPENCFYVSGLSVA